MNTSWDGADHLVWNAGALAVMVVAAAVVAMPRSRGLRHGWPSKVLWTLSILFGFSVSGFLIPLGAVGALWQVTRGWREMDQARGDGGVRVDVPDSGTTVSS
jgi:hypothetical protein